jgi:hypothetical protein
LLSVVIANHLRPRREKVFGEGPRIPLEREAKVRIMHLARALKHKTERGKHYGVLTGNFVDVLHAMLWLIHDGRSGQCNPSYETIAGKAGCAMSRSRHSSSPASSHGSTASSASGSESVTCLASGRHRGIAASAPLQ